MRRLIALTISVVLTLTLAACGASKYMITTNTGETYISEGSPQYDVKSDTYTFTDDKGKKVTINKSEIEVIKEQ